MLGDVHDAIAIARRPAVGAGIAFAGQPDSHFIVDAGRE